MQKSFIRTTHPDAAWFPKAGLGLFLHWGISSVHGRCDISWGMIKHRPWDNGPALEAKEYYSLAEKFNPEKYDPNLWTSAAAKNGFRYAVLTTRHHDGFAMWPSDYGELSTKNYMGGRDLVRPYVEACRAAGLKVGLYYSPPDWYFTRRYMTYDYGVKGPEIPEEVLAAHRAYTKNQITELLTNYGKIDLIWFDGAGSDITIEEIRALQPGIVVNPRLFEVGDYVTPECELPKSRPVSPEGVILPYGDDGWWELCHVLSNGWGYTDDEEYKSLDWFKSMFIPTREMRGNLLLNVGPRPDGQLPELCYKRLDEIGQWLHGEGAGYLSPM